MPNAPASTTVYKMLAPALLAHVHVFEPVKFKVNGRETGEPKYQATFAILKNSPDYSNIASIIMKCAAEMFPGRDIGAEIRAKQFLVPIQSGDAAAAKRNAARLADNKEPDGDWSAGTILLKASTGAAYPPSLGVAIPGGKVDLTAENRDKYKAKFGFGMKGFGIFSFSAYKRVNSDAKDGVIARLNVVFATGEGKLLAGSRSASDEFSGYVGTTTAENPLDDEIPF